MSCLLSRERERERLRFGERRELLYGEDERGIIRDTTGDGPAGHFSMICTYDRYQSLDTQR